MWCGVVFGFYEGSWTFLLAIFPRSSHDFFSANAEPYMQRWLWKSRSHNGFVQNSTKAKIFDWGRVLEIYDLTEDDSGTIKCMLVNINDPLDKEVRGAYSMTKLKGDLST